jgi:hypothetical protein
MTGNVAKKLLVLGDSHAIIWSGCLVGKEEILPRFPHVDVNRLGPALAYNLVDDNGSYGKWGRIAQALVDIEKSQSAAIMLSFGEIDCRTQIVRRANEESISLSDSAKRVADRYIIFLRLLRPSCTQPLFVWGPIASAAGDDEINPELPSVGTQAQRNQATLLFTHHLHAGCSTLPGVYLISIFDLLVTPELATRTQFYAGDHHLNHAGLALGVHALRRVIEHNQLQLPDFFALD